MHALPLYNAKIHLDTELELCMSKEIRSMNIEKIIFCDNMGIHIGNSKKSIHGVLKLIRAEKNFVWKITTVKPEPCHTQSTNYLEDVI